MPKKIRRKLSNAVAGSKNFFLGIPRATRNFYKEIPHQVKSFKAWIFTFRGSLTILCIIGTILIPLITMDDYIITILISFLIFSIFAASWDLLAGFTGQVSFGHSVFFGVGAYVAAAFVKMAGLPWFFSMIIGAVVAVLVGLLVGIPCLRLKGPYLALGTMAFSLIMFNLFMSGELKDILGSTEGISGLPAMSEDLIITFFYILIIMIISFIILTIIIKSNIGTIFKAIRDDETAADASGINTTKYKLIAFMISGFFAGIAGSLFSMNSRAVNPSVFLALYSFYAIVMVALGGLATISGSVLGAFVYWVIFNELFKPLGMFGTVFLFFPTLISAIILIIMIRFAEQGILKPALEHLREFYDFLLGR
ncbi:MAG: branched-chain amino acid ABC transporter permease [Candidatus Lokiarchaeota archaeon]|nr:branched-chain amino acid ABC transporter permease [Candidatus Lokiarchaeota archaeon]